MTYPRMASPPERLTLDCCAVSNHERFGNGYRCTTCGEFWTEKVYLWLCEHEMYEAHPGQATYKHRDRWTPPTWLVLATAITGLLICGALWLAIWLTVQP